MKTFTITIKTDETFDADAFREAVANDIIYLIENGEIEGIEAYTIEEGK